MEEPPKTSSRSTAKLMLLALGVLLAVTFTLMGYVWYANHAAITARLDSLRAEGLPTNVAELNEFYRVPVGVANTTGTWVEVIDGVSAPTPEQTEVMKDLPIVGEGPTPIPPPGTQWAQLDAVAELLAGFEDELKLARAEAGSNGQVRFPVDFSAGFNTLLEYTQNSRQAARILLLDAHVAAHRGDDARALQDVRAMFALSDALRGEPVLISQLVRIAIHAIGCDTVDKLLPHCDWDDDDLASLETAIGTAEFSKEATRALYGERVLLLTELDRMTLGPLRGDSKQTALDFFDQSIAAFDGTPAEIFQYRDQINAFSNQRQKGLMAVDSIVLQLLPAVDAVIVATARATARQRFTNAAIAAKRYRLTQGQFPESLSAIPPELLGPTGESASKLVDPFDGRPLRYRVESSRIVIYSIGSDEVDDGGDCVEKPDAPAPPDMGIVLPK